MPLEEATLLAGTQQDLSNLFSVDIYGLWRNDKQTSALLVVYDGEISWSLSALFTF